MDLLNTYSLEYPSQNILYTAIVLYNSTCFMCTLSMMPYVNCVYLLHGSNSDASVDSVVDRAIEVFLAVVCPGGGTSMFSVPGMCRWTGYSFHHSCSRAGYRFLQKCSQKGILFSNFCSQTGLQCIFLILCSQTGCGFLQFCSQTGVFKMRKMLPDRVKITAPQRHTPVHIRTKCPPRVVCPFAESNLLFYLQGLL